MDNSTRCLIHRLLILLSMLLFLFVNDMSTYEKVERTICILIFSMISIMQGTLGWMGWGDVLTYVGVFFYLGSWNYSCMTLEVFAVYMLLANVLFILGNIKKLDLKNKRLKEDAAFLPGMASAAFLLEVTRGLN